MENITNILNQQSYNNGLISYDLSKKYKLHKARYNGAYAKDDFKLRIDQNKKLYFYEEDRQSNSLLTFLECKEFFDIDNFVLDIFNKNFGIDTNVYSKSSWIYTQVQSFNMNWMHTHKYIFSSNKTSLKTQYTFVFYIQIPKDLEGGEGNIIFKTEDKKLFSYTPSENDVLIFSGDLEHMAVPNQSAIEDRLVYASNLSFSLEEETTFDTPIKFKNIIYDKKIVK